MVDVWDHDAAACGMGHCPECIAQVHFHERIAPRLGRERAEIAHRLAREEFKRRQREAGRRRAGELVEGVLGWLGLNEAAGAGEKMTMERVDEKGAGVA